MCTVNRNAAADICSRGPSDAQMPQIEAGVPDDAVNDEDAATDLDASHTVTVVPVATVISIGGAENPEVGESALDKSEMDPEMVRRLLKDGRVTERLKTFVQARLKTFVQAQACKCSGQSFAGRGKYCSRWGRDYVWCYADQACLSARLDPKSTPPLHVYRCSMSYTDHHNNKDLAAMHKLDNTVAVKEYRLDRGHMNCKNRITATHRDVESKLCMECDDGYYLLIDGTVLSRQSKLDRFGKAVGSCQAISSYALWNKASTFSALGSIYEAECMNFKHSLKGLTRTESGTFEESDSNTVLTKAEQAFKRLKAKGLTKARLNSLWKSKYKKRDKREKEERRLGYVCVAAPIMPGLYLFPRKSYLWASYFEQSTTRFVACHNTNFRQSKLTCTQKKVQGPCTKVTLLGSCQGQEEDEDLKKYCTTQMHRTKVIGNPKGIQGPPYVYNDKAALDQWVAKANQEGHKFIAKYKQNKIKQKKLQASDGNECPAGTHVFHLGSHCCNRAVDKSGDAITHSSHGCEDNDYIACPAGAVDGACSTGEDNDYYDPGKLACEDKYNQQLLSMY